MPKRERKGHASIFQLPSKCVKVKSLNIPDVARPCNETSTTWVQCENEKCLKWRQISPDEAEEVGDGSWYCWMNKDPIYNSCSIPERKAKISKDMKFVYSLLALGEVVMAKMPGYPLWPGILTPDPSCGEYYDALLEKENEPIQYHVEFLGPCHSRAWLVPRKVHPYNSVSEEEKALPLRKTPFKLQTSYRLAVKEAREILPLLPQKRLQLSNHFKLNDWKRKENVEDASRKVKYSAKLPSCCSDKRISDPEIAGFSDADDGHMLSTDENTCINTSIVKKYSTWKQPSERKHCRSSRLKNRKTSQHPDDKENVLNSDEKDFFESVKSVLIQKGLPPPKLPMWRGQQVSLLALFNAVQRQGGFEAVCKCKMWTNIYNELVQPSGNGTGGTGARVRLFYQRHLLPYEVFIRSTQVPVVDSQSVPDVGTTPLPAVNMLEMTRDKRERSFSTSTSGSESEQKVPDVPCVLKHHKDNSGAIFDAVNIQPSYQVDQVPDCVPSSNPDTPLSQYIGDPSSDSEDDEDDIEVECHAAEYELLQLERLLSSIEPSLYPPQVQESPEKRRLPVMTSSPSPSLPSGVDVLKTLDDMSRIEGAIAELDTMVSLELENI